MLIDWSRSIEGEAVSVNVTDLAQLKQVLSGHFEKGQGFRVATLNLDHVVKLRDDPSFHAAYLAHDYVTADGNPIVWLSRLARSPVSLVAGADLIWPLVRLAAEKGVNVALLGSTKETLDTASEAMCDRYPSLKVVCRLAPPMGFDPTGDLAKAYCAELQAANVGLCFLALGAPKQERLAAFAAEHAPDVGFVSIGAGLDFIASTQTRAPWIVRRLAAEWLWRLLGNPRRLAGRYAACIAILPRLTLSAWEARRQKGQRPS